MIEREGGSKVEVPGYEGWALPELDTIGTRAGGATRAQLDAFKLLAVFIQHSDSKPGQQEIVCQEGRKGKDAKGNETCAEAWLVIKDLGGSFGKATKLNSSKMNLADWDEARHLEGRQAVHRRHAAVVHGKSRGSEDQRSGSRFLSERLMLLRDQTDSRPLHGVECDETWRNASTAADGSKRPVTVDDWVRVFKRKRSEIAAARCAA